MLLPYIYVKPETYDDGPANEYICLTYNDADEEDAALPVSALILLLEPEGGLSRLSIFTLPVYHRQGYTSGLLSKAVFTARQ